MAVKEAARRRPASVPSCGLVPAPPVLYFITITLLRWLAQRGSAERQFT